MQSSDYYNAYGQQLNGASGDEFGFGGQAGYRTDAETGLCLLGQRYYDPAAGRFLTRDPAGYAGGMDLYAYGGDDPVNEMDPSGLGDGDGTFGGDQDFNPWAYISNALDNLTSGDWLNIWHHNDVVNATGTLANVAMNVPLPDNPAFDAHVGEACADGLVDGVKWLAGRRPKFPFLKDHAERHGFGMTNNEYLADAVSNIKSGRLFRISHDGVPRNNYVSPYGNGLYRYTSTSPNGRIIFTHMTEGDKIDAAYLQRQGITLPNGF